MRQIPLDIRLADHAVFDAFFPGPNALALKSLRDLIERPGWSISWLWGTFGTGRSHLLQAAVSAFGSVGSRSAYLPLVLIQGLGPGAIDGFGDASLVAIDDVDRVAGDPEWERALFRLYESLQATNARLIVAASVPPGQAGFKLADLQSRLSSGAVFRLLPLTDEDSMRALQLRASLRGITIPDDTATYLLTRVERSLPALFDVLDQLDLAALAAKRPLTVPFVRAILESRVLSSAQ
jgi:DnaA family protein